MKFDKNRITSFAGVGIAVFFVLMAIIGPSGGAACQNAGCVGSGAAQGLQYIFLMAISLVFAFVFSYRSYAAIAKPRSKLRFLKIFVIFCLTLMSVSLLVMFFL